MVHHTATYYRSMAGSGLCAAALIVLQALLISVSIVITIIMLFAVWTVMLLFLVQSVPMVRLECTDGALLRAQCSSVSMVRCELKYSIYYCNNNIIILYTAFLMYESQSSSVRIRCGHPATSYLWSKSDDGSAANAVILDTSSDKYTVVDGNSLDDNNIIIKVDSGLYRCVYGLEK